MPSNLLQKSTVKAQHQNKAVDKRSVTTAPDQLARDVLFEQKKQSAPFPAARDFYRPNAAIAPDLRDTKGLKNINRDLKGNGFKRR